MNISTMIPISFSDKNISENDLEQYIINNPSILSLGDISIINSQLKQEYGILDILAYDSISNIYYEIEIMLGDADSRHITHILEYWSIERCDKPFSTHIAVLISESIRGRYQKLLSILPDFLPLICSEINLYKSNEQLIINCQPIYYPNKLYKKHIKSKKRVNIRVSDLFISFIDKIMLDPSLLKKNRRTLAKETNTSLGSSTNFIQNLKYMDYIDDDYNLININKLQDYIEHLHQVFDCK